MESSVLTVIDPTLGVDTMWSPVKWIYAGYLGPSDTVYVQFGTGWLLATVADAAELVDKLTAALDERTSTLRAVA